MDIAGDLLDLIGRPILLAEEVIYERENPSGVEIPAYQDGFTWTFYKLSTMAGSVTIRWYGQSNGYYSERVTFKQVHGDHKVPDGLTVNDIPNKEKVMFSLTMYKRKVKWKK